jgi:hypothetical protein
MKSRFIAFALCAAIAAPTSAFLIGCDREIAHEEHVKQNADGTSTKKETTVKEKPDGTVVKETDKKVDNVPNR